MFGSRADPERLGGDIDLLLEDVPSENISVEAKIAFLSDLEKQMGDQKIDIVFRTTDKASYKALTEEQISHTDQLIYRFSQLQDTLGGKIFPAVLPTVRKAPPTGILKMDRSRKAPCL